MIAVLFWGYCCLWSCNSCSVMLCRSFFYTWSTLSCLTFCWWTWLHFPLVITSYSIQRELHLAISVCITLCSLHLKPEGSWHWKLKRNWGACNCVFKALVTVGLKECPETVAPKNLFKINLLHLLKYVISKILLSITFCLAITWLIN